MSNAHTRRRPLVGGKYQILKKIGEGGMAEIYLARRRGAADPSRVVLKRIHPRHAGRADVVAMFLDEARVAARLQHINVAQVFETLEDPLGYFLVMEYLPGVDVATALRALREHDQRISHQCAIAIVAGACAGLHYAHELRAGDGSPLGVVHRDVSPSNLFVTDGGIVKVLDFGIARAADRVTETESGVLKGKLVYMSPEQVSGRELDRRSDLFALGVVLYQLTVGSRPFDRPGDAELFISKRIADGEYRAPRVLVPNYPRALELVIERALAVQPDQRFATAEEMLAALDKAAAELGLTCSPPCLAQMVQELRQAKKKQAAGAKAARARPTARVAAPGGLRGSDTDPWAMPERAAPTTVARQSTKKARS